MLKSKKLIIVFLVIIFMMPGVCAYWLYQHPHFLLGDATNKGKLLSPPVLIKALPKTAKWGLLVWSPDVCTKVCREQLNKIMRIRLALGRRFYDVDLWFITNSAATFANVETSGFLDKQGVRSVVLTSKSISKMQVLGAKPQVFIVSPNNYLILSYRLTAKPADIYHDLQRVMNTQRSL